MNGRSRRELLWREMRARRKLVPSGARSAVELSASSARVSLHAAGRAPTGARNEAEYLPLLRRHEHEPPAPFTRKPVVLIAEDERDADPYQEALRINGIRAVSAATRPDALRLTRDLLADCRDSRLPAVQGTRLRHLRAAATDPSAAAIRNLVVTAAPQGGTSDCPAPS